MLMSIIQKNIAYKISDRTIEYCSYKIMKDEHLRKNAYCIEYTQGRLGDYNDWDCYISDNEQEIVKIEEEIKKDYQNTIVPQNAITISITISIDFLTEKKLETSQVTQWIRRTIEYACFNCGLGVVTEHVAQTILSQSYFKYNSELNILYSSKLTEMLQELMEPWGINFSDSRNSVTIS